MTESTIIDMYEIAVDIGRQEMTESGSRGKWEMTESIATANSAISELPEKHAEQLKPMILIYIHNLTFKIIWQVGMCSTTANLLDLLDFVEMAFYLHLEGMTQRTACSYLHNHKQKCSNCQQFAFKCLKNYTYIPTYPSSSTPSNTYIFFINVHTDISSNAQKYIHTLLQVPQKYTDPCSSAHKIHAYQGTFWVF